MSKRTSDWAIAQRNGQAVRIAIALTTLLFFVLVFKEEPQTLLRTERKSATITAIKVIKRESHSRFSGASVNITYVVKLILTDGKQLKFILLQAPPKVGTQVPVIINIYDNGKNDYHYSLIEWQLLKY